MSDKLNFSTAALKRLQNYSLLALEGPDAVAFIQAQSMNDVKALAAGEWHWNGLLNPKGRLIALFALLQIQPDLLWLVSPDMPADKLQAHLQRFVFRSKVKLQCRTDIIFAGEFDGIAENVSPSMKIHGDMNQGMTLDFSSRLGPRKLHLIPEHLAADSLPDTDAEARWRDADILQGLPRLSEKQTELWTPQMLSLEYFNAYSLKKGCYPGQEIVARTHFLGQAKRSLRLVFAENLRVSEAVHRDEEKIGEIICVTSHADAGLAVLQNVTDAESLLYHRQTLKHAHILGGFQRTP
jgi:tRNA-modifying protein YgfZ